MSTIDGRYLSNRQAFADMEEQGQSDPSGEDRAFDAKLAQLQQNDAGQPARVKRQFGQTVAFRGEFVTPEGELGLVSPAQATMAEAAARGESDDFVVPVGDEGFVDFFESRGDFYIGEGVVDDDTTADDVVNAVNAAFEARQDGATAVPAPGAGASAGEGRDDDDTAGLVLGLGAGTAVLAPGAGAAVLMPGAGAAGAGEASGAGVAASAAGAGGAGEASGAGAATSGAGAAGAGEASGAGAAASAAGAGGAGKWSGAGIATLGAGAAGTGEVLRAIAETAGEASDDAFETASEGSAEDAFETASEGSAEDVFETASEGSTADGRVTLAGSVREPYISSVTGQPVVLAPYDGELIATAGSTSTTSTQTAFSGLTNTGGATRPAMVAGNPGTSGETSVATQTVRVPERLTIIPTEAGVTVERLTDPLYLAGDWFSLIPQRDPTALAPSPWGTYLLSDRGAGVRPIVFRGSQSGIYDTLTANANEIIENISQNWLKNPEQRPEKPEDWWTKPEDWSEEVATERPSHPDNFGDNPIFAGFVKDPGVKPGVHQANDYGTRALKQIANLGLRFSYAGPAPGSAAGAVVKGLKASSTVSKKLGDLIRLTKVGSGAGMRDVFAVPNVVFDLFKDSQKTMLKITNHPEKGLTQVGNGSVRLGDIAEILKRGQRPG